MAQPKKIADEYRELAENHNRLAVKFNKLVAERKKDMSILDQQQLIVGKLKSKLSTGWPSALSGIAGMIGYDAPEQVEVLYLKSLVHDFEHLVNSTPYHRDEEIILAHLIGKALYTFFWETSLEHSECTIMLDMVTQYLNANARYLIVENHGLTKHYDGRFHETDKDIQEMEKIKLSSFLIKDSNSNNILRKALVSL